MKITLALDADDTLWHNERIFLSTKEVFQEMLSAYHDQDWIEERLDQTEIKNIRRFGYGIKGFTLSMIETAVELTEGRISGGEIAKIIDLGKEMLRSPIELLDGVADTVEKLSRETNLFLITKGDLFDQETKIARSGLADLFSAVEIVSEKSPATYSAILKRHEVSVEMFAMVGNSLKSDVLPVIDIGGKAAHVPYETEWVLEKVPSEELELFEYDVLESIKEVPEWIEQKSS